MEIVIFILVIVALIVVHEFGHFVVAKLLGMRVDEFGLGYPPRALTIGRVGETEYTLNWLPLGGFVKIYGEDDAKALGSRAFASKPRIHQAAVLVAGVAMNLLFAYVLITGALVVGTPRALTPEEVSRATDMALAVSGVLPGSPAALAGLLPGDTILSAVDKERSWSVRDPSTGSDKASPESFTAFVAGSAGDPVTLMVRHNDTDAVVTVTPAVGVVAESPSRYALGIGVATIGIVPLSLLPAIVEGARLTWGATTLTAIGLWDFLSGILTLHADLSQVAGPVGIAGVVGDASSTGLGNLFSVMAIISINLALINLIPVPALDGGRLLVVIIEGIIRRPIRPSVTRAVTAASFVLLIFLMVVVTLHDISRIVG